MESRKDLRQEPGKQSWQRVAFLILLGIGVLTAALAVASNAILLMFLVAGAG